MKQNIIRSQSFAFSLQIIALYKKLIDEKEYVLSKQLLRSGTSIGANVEEAGAAQSRKDFISKMAIASKEARETRYWLRLYKESELTQLDMDFMLDEVQGLVNILTAIVKTTQQRL